MGRMVRIFILTLVCDGKTFVSTKQCIMYKKAEAFGDIEIISRIVSGFRSTRRWGRMVRNLSLILACDGKMFASTEQHMMYRMAETFGNIKVMSTAAAPGGAQEDGQERIFWRLDNGTMVMDSMYTAEMELTGNWPPSLALGKMSERFDMKMMDSGTMAVRPNNSVGVTNIIENITRDSELSTCGDDIKYDGCFVVVPTPGCYEGVVMLDGNSLYGSILKHLQIMVVDSMYTAETELQ
ncbi:hypothetical protein QQS21_010774 [Conoideocrella luteorostrata]|uniref:Uncharacterized protein n=1 Tax=Conoideocrella luteorostrata TaxID=1105319 RepID=A0AAJ0FTW1_9HYPO|nr:hypothetical protein QQS21_010774 [Conoideocrella luteorostrata]